MGSRLAPQLSHEGECRKERPVCWSGWNCAEELAPRGGFGDPQSDPRNRFRGLVGSQVGLHRLMEVIPSETHTGSELPPSPASGSTPPGLIREAAAPGHLLSARVTAERKAGTPRMELPHGRLPVLEVTTYSSCWSSGRRRGQDPRGPHGARSAVTALGHVPGMGRGDCAGRKAEWQGVPPWTS